MIVFDIEDTFGIEIPYNANEEVADFKTVGSVVDRVKALMAGARARRRPRLDTARSTGAALPAPVSASLAARDNGIDVRVADATRAASS